MYTQGLHGSLTADIAGAAPGQYDQLNVSGHAQLNGLLTVNLLNGFVPQIGNMFDILNFASESGTFSMVDGLPINSQEHFVLEYNATNLTLDVVPGQLTGVDASSASWLFGSGSEEKGILLNASDSGTPSSTPEPGSILLFGSGMLGLAGILRHRLVDLYYDELIDAFKGAHDKAFFHHAETFQRDFESWKRGGPYLMGC